MKSKTGRFIKTNSLAAVILLIAVIAKKILKSNHRLKQYNQESSIYPGGLGRANQLG